MRRDLVVPLAVVVAVAGAVAAGIWWWQLRPAGTEASAAQGGDDGRDGRREKAERWLQKLEGESRELMPEVLEGVALGMREAELREARPGVRPSRKQRGSGDKRWLEEPLEGGARALYGLQAGGLDRLVQVQVMSRLPRLEAVRPHLTAMNERYGSATGVWRCPDTGGTPTLRFTWRKNVTSLADVFLIHPGGVSVTLYIAPTETIGTSLRKGNCRPTSPEDLEQFPPVASPEQLKAGSGQGER